MKELIPHLRSELEGVFGGRRWIIAVDVLASATGMTEALQELGAEQALCIGASRGAGTLPDADFAPDPIVFDVVGEDMMSSVRASMHRLANLPSEAQRRIDAFDPEGTVRVIGTLFDGGDPVGGRLKYGARPKSWQALEDKTVIDSVWDAIGVPRAPSENVAVSDTAGLAAASKRVDLGAGAVWAADNREGFHGGASFVRAVRNEHQAQAAQALFAPHADFARVMPYLEGIPCSIHGIVFDDRVVVLRPCEMVVFSREDGSFLYAKAGTFWDPPAARREEMRDIARRTGAHLRSTVGYRGAFTLDGVMTAEGFRPTELNPRFGAALGIQTSALDLPFYFLNLAIVEGEDVEWRPEELEEALLAIADGQRSGGTMAIAPGAQVDDQTVHLVFESGDFRRADDGEEHDAKVVAGPHAAGAIVLVSFVRERTPIGPSLAPRAAAALRWADSEWNLGLGALTPARDMDEVTP